jgi:uncharacterized membrane protein
MKVYLVSYCAMAVIFFGCDAVWLTLAGNALYRPLLGDLVLERFKAGPAILFYLLYIAGAVYFAIAPAVSSDRWTTALVNGALFGFFAYGTYDLTNLATIRGWSTTITVIDLCWGTALTGICATLGYLIATALTRAASA